MLLGGVVALCALAWMAFLPVVAEHELREITHFDVRMEVVAVNPLTGSVVIRGFVAKNPAEYPDPDFFDIRSIKADVSVFSLLFSDHIVVEELDVDIAKVELIRLHDGRTNEGQFVASFKPGGAASAPGAPSAPRKARTYLIKKLHVRFDELVVSDNSGSKTDKSTYDLHISQDFINISGPGQLLVPSVVRDLHSFGLHHDVSGLLPGDFGDALAVAVGSAATVGGKIQSAAKDTGQYLKDQLDKLEQKVKP
jgi:hypothetical protein